MCTLESNNVYQSNNAQENLARKETKKRRLDTEGIVTFDDQDEFQLDGQGKTWNEELWREEKKKAVASAGRGADASKGPCKRAAASAGAGKVAAVGAGEVASAGSQLKLTSKQTKTQIQTRHH